MATFQRKTLRNLTPLAREIAEAINECDAVKRRLTRLMDHMLDTELDAAAFRHKHPQMASDVGGKRFRMTRPDHNRGRQNLADLDAAFHDPAPLERRALNE